MPDAAKSLTIANTGTIVTTMLNINGGHTADIVQHLGHQHHHHMNNHHHLNSNQLNQLNNNNLNQINFNNTNQNNQGYNPFNNSNNQTIINGSSAATVSASSSAALQQSQPTILTTVSAANNDSALLTTTTPASATTTPPSSTVLYDHFYKIPVVVSDNMIPMLSSINSNNSNLNLNLNGVVNNQCNQTLINHNLNNLKASPGITLITSDGKSITGDAATIQEMVWR